MKRIAIIGAGLSGLVLGKRLADKAEVTLFEKSRGVSGRLPTRRAEGYEFDHGAQFLTARSKAFQQFLAPYIASGDIAEWQPRVITLSAGEKPYTRPWFEPHFIGAPMMTSLCRKLAQDQDIQLETRITALTRTANGWLLDTEEQQLEPEFDWVICTAPAPQTREMLADFLAEEVLSGEGGLDDVVMSPCFALMQGYNNLPSLPFEAARVKDSPVEWIMLNTSKAGRNANPALVIQSSNAWAEENLERPAEEVINMLQSEAEQVMPTALPEPDYVSLHRWRYARVEQALEQDYLFDASQGLAACGDWACEGRVEGAFTSASRLADAMEQVL